MAAPADRVQVLKQETTALGGQDADSRDWPVPINPQQDGIEAAGLFIQDAVNRDETTYIVRSGLDLLLADGNNPETALSTLRVVDWKNSVRAATTGNIVLSGTQTIDGVVLAVGNRVLVKNQTAATENGIYVVAAGAWARSPDANASNLVTSQLIVCVEEGTAAGSSMWRLATANPITLGTTGLTFTSVAGGTGASPAGAKGDVQLKATGANLEVESAAGYGFNYNTSTHSLTIGPAGTNLANNPCSVNGNIDAFVQSNVQNTMAGASASSDIVATANNGNDNNNYVDVGINSSVYNDPAYAGGPDDSYILNLGGDLIVSVATAGKGFRATCGGSTDADEKFGCTAAGNFYVGIAALALNAANGFLYLASCAGAPTGTPTALSGRTPVVIDSTNSTFNFYSGGAWKTLDPNLQQTDWSASVRIATVSALPANTRTGNVLTATANGAFPTIDGINLAVGQRILVKNEATGANNGIYTLTNAANGGSQWVLTRATDADTSAKITNGCAVYVGAGTANTGQVWILTTADPITLNTTAQTWTQYQPNARHFEVNAAGPVTTTSTSDVLVTSMTITPGAGTYQVIFTSDLLNNTLGTTTFVCAYAAGAFVTNSNRTLVTTAITLRVPVALSCIATVAAGQAIEIRWHVTAGTASMGQRSFSLIKVG